MTPDEVFSLAREAIKAMAAQHGKGHRFTYDQIWSYLPSGIDVLSSQRPGPQRRLLNDGIIRKTGKMRNAASQARAGNLAPEYCFGPATLGFDQEESQATVIDVLRDGPRNCLSILLSLPASKYLSVIKRTGLATPAAAKRPGRPLIEDCARSGVFSPLILGLVVPSAALDDAPPPGQDKLDDLLSYVSDDNCTIISGLEETAALMELKDDLEVMRRRIRVELWLAPNVDGIAARVRNVS